MKDRVLRLQEQVNIILAEWNPIGVPTHIAFDEYTRYVPRIIDALQKKGELMNCLEDILVNQLGLEYDSNNETHLKDLQNVYSRLLSISKD